MADALQTGTRTKIPASCPPQKEYDCWRDWKIAVGQWQAKVLQMEKKFAEDLNLQKKQSSSNCSSLLKSMKKIWAGDVAYQLKRQCDNDKKVLRGNCLSLCNSTTTDIQLPRATEEEVLTDTDKEERQKSKNLEQVNTATKLPVALEMDDTTCPDGSTWHLDRGFAHNCKIFNSSCAPCQMDTCNFHIKSLDPDCPTWKQRSGPTPLPPPD